MTKDFVACVRFADLVNMAVEIRDLRAELDNLRQPITEHLKHHALAGLDKKLNMTAIVDAPVKQKIAQGVKTDREGHVTDDFGYCSQKGCKFSRGYRTPKGKKL